MLSHGTIKHISGTCNIIVDVTIHVGSCVVDIHILANNILQYLILNLSEFMTYIFHIVPC